MTTNLRYFAGVFLVALVLDQGSKAWILESLHYREIWVILPGFFDLTHVRNPGGAFSFLADAPQTARLTFFIATTLVAIGILFYFYAQLDAGSKLASAALGAILGGAVGNLTDRILHLEVIDFLDVHITNTYTWPTFNFADSFIVVGIGLLLIETFFESREPDAKGPHAPAES